ncbi:MAG: hypothetical protein ACK4V6_08630 [Microthrixaceae bacterium]
MLAKLVHARIRPERLDLAARAVEDELAPAFAARRGARLGCWMGNRANGHVLAMTLWADESCAHAEQATDGAERARVAERIGLELHAVETLDVVAVHDLDELEPAVPDREPSGNAGAGRASSGAGGLATRWARVTWVEGVELSALDHLPELHASIAPDQASSDGFCASYWFADHHTGDGMALSTWASAAQLRDGEPDSRRRRRAVERALGCHVAMVGEYEALGVTVRPGPELQLHLFDGPLGSASADGSAGWPQRPSGRIAV